ncbi:MAG: ice-binding family protein, partial [Pyrinomonadaceae bacterium]
MKKNLPYTDLNLNGRNALCLTIFVGLLVAAAGYFTMFNNTSSVSAARDEAEVATPEMIRYALDFKGDMAKSLSAINQLPCTELKGSALGGKTLTPGVYCLASADLAGDLRLDGQNDASSVFIFRIAGSLNAKAGSSVVLENLAQAGSVFFIANDKATIGTGSSFNGRILAENDIVVESGAFVGGKMASAKGRVSASPEANLGGGTGTLQICKVVEHEDGAVDLRNRIFHFTVTGVAETIRVPHGNCSSPIDVPVGPATITEHDNGTFVDSARTWSGNFQLVQVRRTSPTYENPQSTLGTINLPLRTAAINIVEGGSNRQLIVEFTNKYAITGYVEICKYPATGPDQFNPNGDPDVTGFFQYTVEGVYSQPNSTVLQIFSAPVGQCSGPIAVTISTPVPTGDPRSSSVRITELGRVTFYLESTTVEPPARKIDDPVLGRGINAAGADVANVGGGWQRVEVIEGGSEDETRVNFFNRSRPGIVKVCKIAGPGIPFNTIFTFVVRGIGPTTSVLPPQGPIGTVLRRVKVRAGDPANGGNCQIVPGFGAGNNNEEFQTFLSGTPVEVFELGTAPEPLTLSSAPQAIAPTAAPESVDKQNLSIEDPAYDDMKRRMITVRDGVVKSDAIGRPASLGGGPVRILPGCTTNTLAANDDGSTGAVALPFNINYFGVNYAQTFVNNNGNITFSGPLGTFTPFPLGATNVPIIAPFFADVDTRGAGSGLVQYGNTTVDARTAFCANWVNVGYFGSHIDKLNSFQLILIDRSDTGTGNFDIEMNYDQIQWETGDASGGSGGLGGSSARAGYANGTMDAGTFFEFPGSAVNGGLLDSNNGTGLRNRSTNSDELGRHIFSVRDGLIGAGPRIRVSRIRSTSGFFPGIFDPNPDLEPGLEPGIGAYIGRAAIPARSGVVEVEFTNFLFAPTEFKVCKIAGTGVPVGTPFTFDVSLISPVGPGNIPLFPDFTTVVTVSAGPSTPEMPNGGFCFVVDGSGLLGGSFNQGSHIRVTERPTTPATTVSAITSDTTPVVVDVPNRTVDIGGLVSGVNIVTFTNTGSGGPGTLAYRAPYDFDGDNKSDLSIYRSSTGSWWWAATSQGGTHNSVNWGMPTDKLAAADYDGDGKTDP